MTMIVMMVIKDSYASSSVGDMTLSHTEDAANT